MLSLFLLAIFLACVVLLFSAGLWKNVLRLINVVMAILLAVNFFEPLAGALENYLGVAYTYFCDFVALWGLFVVSLAVLRMGTEFVGPVKVAFGPKVDRAGSVLCAGLIGWVLVCFTLLSMHTAPLPRCFLGFQPEVPTLLGVAPDRALLGFLQGVSQGAFAAPISEENVAAGSHGIDPTGDFLLKYNVRRASLEDHVRARNSLFLP